MIIRSTKVSTKFTNQHKLNCVQSVITDYKRVVSSFVDLLWGLEKVPTLVPKNITDQIDSWFSARMLQCAAKQASGIVRGVRKKHDARLAVIAKLNKQGHYKKARKLQAIHNKRKHTKPTIENIEIELDSRFVEIDLDTDTTFDGYLTLTSLGQKLRLNIPFRRTKHFNKLYKKGKLKGGVRLSEGAVTFMFELPAPTKPEGKVLGIDIGKCETLSCSDGFQTKPNKHGHSLNTILPRLSRKQKGSKGFRREQEHRKNYINWSINQLNLSQISEVKIEKIKNIRKGKRTSRMLGHWTYTDIFDKLRSKCEEQGVLVSQVNPTYTSQRCSECGWTRKRNRKGKQFKCDKCGFTHDSDLNASRNISLDLRPIKPKERQLNLNRTGFYWLVGEETIVPCVQETK